MKRSTVLALSVAAALAGGLTTAGLFADDGAKPPVAPAPATKEDKVRTLLRLQGGEALAKMSLDKMLDQFAKMPTLPAGFIEKFREKADVHQLMELALPSYVKHLDDATLDATIAFYETPAGRNLSAQLPSIQMEAMDAGVVWGTKLGGEVMKELRAGGEKPVGGDKK